MEQIISWSYSKYRNFAKCKFMTKLKYLDKISEPERELRPGQTEHANDRGSRIHDSCEKYVNGSGSLIAEMKEFEAEFVHLKHLYEQGKVSLEGEWGMNDDWEPVLWKNAWLHLKLDAMVRVSKTKAVVIDYKSGKKYGNEVKHAEQLQLYALVTFLRYPELEEIWAELWYLDVKELTSVLFTRSMALRFKPSWNRKGTALTTCTSFPPNPNVYSCQWCPYGSWGTGHCTVGVKK